MRIPAYLRLSRHGIYFFRICIPLPLQHRWQSGRELKVSLRTRDQRAALAKARDLAIAAHKHFGYALAHMSVKPFDPNDMTTWPTQASDIRKFEKTIETVNTAEGLIERVKYKVDPTSSADIAAARADEILHQKRQRFMRQPNSPGAQAFFEAEDEELRRSIMADAELADARRKAELAELEVKIKSASQVAVRAPLATTASQAVGLQPVDAGVEGSGTSSGAYVRQEYVDTPQARAVRERRDAASQAQFDKYKLSALWLRFRALKMKELGIRAEDLERTDLDAKTAGKVKTIRTYMMKFGVFMDWAGERHIQDVNHEDITEYKEHLMNAVKVRAGRKAGQTGLDLPTVDNYVGVLNGLYKWAQKGGLYPRQMLLPTHEQRETTKAMKRDRARSGLVNRGFKSHELVKAFDPQIYLAENRSAHHYWPARSGPANLNSAISGNSGHEAGPRMVWREGVFNGEEISATHPSYAHAGIQGPGGRGCVAGGQDTGGAGQAVRSAPQPDHGVEAPASGARGRGLRRRRWRSGRAGQSGSATRQDRPADAGE